MRFQFFKETPEGADLRSTLSYNTYKLEKERTHHRVENFANEIVPLFLSGIVCPQILYTSCLQSIRRPSICEVGRLEKHDSVLFSCQLPQSSWLLRVSFYLYILPILGMALPQQQSMPPRPTKMETRALAIAKQAARSPPNHSLTLVVAKYPTAAMSENFFGAATGQGSGPACGRCYLLKAYGDPYGSWCSGM